VAYVTEITLPESRLLAAYATQRAPLTGSGTREGGGPWGQTTLIPRMTVPGIRADVDNSIRLDATS